MSTRASGAHTVLGTPYYISPEMCEGKGYDEKSDIWALGCIVYEMACLQKTFEGSNLPALGTKIMRGQFAPIKGQYSPMFKQLVRDLLQRDPEYRPSASTILLERMPELLSQFENRFVNYDSDEVPELDENGLEVMQESGGLSFRKVKTSRRPLRSVLYYMKGHEASLVMTPVQLPPRSKILQVCKSEVQMSGFHILKNVMSSNSMYLRAQIFPLWRFHSTFKQQIGQIPSSGIRVVASKSLERVPQF